MKFLVLFLFVAVASALVPQLEDFETEWIKFKIRHDKAYRSVLEEKTRRSIFNQTYNKIKTHNELYAKGEKTYWLKINEFADLTKDEMQSRRGGIKPLKKMIESNDIEVYEYEIPDCADLPDSIDWREQGAVTRVKNQGDCGSCWAFSVTGALEAQYFFKSGILVPLSEQNLVDCCRLDDTAGCDGGWMTTAFTCIYNDNGIMAEDAYPYVSGNTHESGKCKYNSSISVTSLKGYNYIPENDEETLVFAVGQEGPVSVSIDASSENFAAYGGGVYYDESCSPENIDHAVLIVGYGHENGMDYWLIKNSWGTAWGERGYFKLARNKNNHCGVASVASFPFL